MPKVSIILPVYNAGNSVSRMIETILNQTFRDWELIVVDDGSTDKTSEIINSYAHNDDRINVVRKENGGVASARQAGLDIAQGEYIIHADADDYIEETMLKEMLSKAESENADVCISDYFVDSSGCSRYCKQTVNVTDQLDYLYSIYSGKNLGSLWHKLIRREVINKNEIFFADGIDYCEDLLFLTKLFHSGNLKISYLPRAYYHYVISENSLTRKTSMKGHMSLVAFHDRVRILYPEFVDRHNLNEKFDNSEFLSLYMNRLYSSKDELITKYKKNKRSLIKNTGVRWRIGYLLLEMGMIELSHKLLKF